MAFLTQSELITHDRLEIINAIIEDDTTVVPSIISESIAEVKSYLNQRFDVETIFEKTGTQRDEMILSILKDIVIFRIHKIVSVEVTETVKDANDKAIQWLKLVAKNTITPDLPVTSEQAAYDPVLYGSNKKRENHY